MPKESRIKKSRVFLLVRHMPSKETPEKRSQSKALANKTKRFEKTAALESGIQRKTKGPSMLKMPCSEKGEEKKCWKMPQPLENCSESSGSRGSTKRKATAKDPRNGLNFSREGLANNTIAA